MLIILTEDSIRLGSPSISRAIRESIFSILVGNSYDWHIAPRELVFIHTLGVVAKDHRSF